MLSPWFNLSSANGTGYTALSSAIDPVEDATVEVPNSETAALVESSESKYSTSMSAPRLFGIVNVDTNTLESELVSTRTWLPEIV